MPVVGAVAVVVAVVVVEGDAGAEEEGEELVLPMGDGGREPGRASNWAARRRRRVRS